MGLKDTISIDSVASVISTKHRNPKAASFATLRIYYLLQMLWMKVHTFSES